MGTARKKYRRPTHLGRESSFGANGRKTLQEFGIYDPYTSGSLRRPHHYKQLGQFRRLVALGNSLLLVPITLTVRCNSFRDMADCDQNRVFLRIGPCAHDSCDEIDLDLRDISELLNATDLGEIEIPELLPRHYYCDFIHRYIDGRFFCEIVTDSPSIEGKALLYRGQTHEAIDLLAAAKMLDRMVAGEWGRDFREDRIRPGRVCTVNSRNLTQFALFADRLIFLNIEGGPRTSRTP